jgi:hypothetical protein
LSVEVRALRGSNADAVIARLNPIITGWAAYYRIGVSKRSFAALDAHMWRLVHKWAGFTHPNKPVRWVTAQYFGMFNPARRDKWVFGNQKNGFYLRKFAWTPIIRHRMVAATASPDNRFFEVEGAGHDLRVASLRLVAARHWLCSGAAGGGATSYGGQYDDPVRLARCGGGTG